MEQKKRFYPFERVIWRSKDDNDNVWKCSFYSHYMEHNCMHNLVGLMSISDRHCYILPFKGNEHLVGTTNAPDEDEVELKEGTICLFSDVESELESGFGTMARFRNKDGKFGEDNVFVVYFANGNESIFRFCIPLAKFNPEDTDKNKNEILCVNNGRIIKAK